MVNQLHITSVVGLGCGDSGESGDSRGHTGR